MKTDCPESSLGEELDVYANSIAMGILERMPNISLQLTCTVYFDAAHRI